MVLFDNYSRTNYSYKSPNESSYNYLNNSAREEFVLSRKILENWFIKYPNDNKDTFCKRFKSSNDACHYSAFWELYTYILFYNQGFNIKLHPILITSNNHNDFEILDGNKTLCYVEATVSYDNNLITSKRKQENIIIEYINDHLTSDKIIFQIEFISKSNNTTSFKKIVYFLRKSLETLDLNELNKIINQKDYEKIPKYEWKEDNWHIVFTPFINESKTQCRLIASHDLGPIYADNKSSIQRSIQKKANKYKITSHPFLIMLNTLNEFPPDEIDIQEALFGKESWNLSFKNMKLELNRIPDGAWTSKKGPKNKRISGVYIGSNIMPWSINSSNITLWLNPWAYHNVPDSLLMGNIITYNTDTLKFNTDQNKSIQDILNIMSI